MAPGQSAYALITKPPALSIQLEGNPLHIFGLAEC